MFSIASRARRTPPEITVTVHSIPPPLLQKSYTADGLLASLTDANSHTTSFAYDRFDRLATTYPLGTTETLVYDADSNVTSRATRAGATIAFTYDTLNRLATKTPPAPATTVTYGYDLVGRLTSVIDTSAAIVAAVPPPADYVTSASYDALNRPTGLAWSPAPISAAPAIDSVTFGHSYNKANQRAGQTVTDNTWFNYPAATPSTVSYSADALNRYTNVGGVTPTYDGNSNLTSDGTFTFGYDAENRLTSAGAALIERIKKNVLRGVGLLLAATIGLRVVLELLYFDSPRQPDPATGRIVPYAVKNVLIYITENLSDVFYWLQWSFYFSGAVIVVIVIVDLVWPLKSNK
jgi:YD repeat-containing protein